VRKRFWTTAADVYVPFLFPAAASQQHAGWHDPRQPCWPPRGQQPPHGHVHRAAPAAWQLRRQQAARGHSGSPPSSADGSPLALHHYTSQRAKTLTPKALTSAPQQALHSVAGKLSKGQRYRQRRQLAKQQQAASSPIGGGGNGGQQARHPEAAARVSPTATLKAKAAVAEIEAGIERLGLSKAPAAAGSNKAPGGGVKCAAAQAPLQLPEVQRKSGVHSLPTGLPAGVPD